MTAPLERAAGEAVQLPWPIGAAARRGLGAAVGAEAGVVSGYASRKVLGQFDVALGKRPRASRLLLVEPNVVGAAAGAGGRARALPAWVVIHEQTHSVQFASVPWLRDHLAGLLDRLLEASGEGLDATAIAALARRLVTTDPRESVRAALRGELARALAGPEQQALLDGLQAAMAVVEGYAEHVMDAAVAGEPEMAGLREAIAGATERARRPGRRDRACSSGSA